MLPLPARLRPCQLTGVPIWGSCVSIERLFTFVQCIVMKSSHSGHYALIKESESQGFVRAHTQRKIGEKEKKNVDSTDQTSSESDQG